jgi:pyruvate dehydrogenase (quinone)
VFGKKQTVADQLVEVLVQAGVQRIYGIVGDSLTAFSDAIRRSGEIQWVHVRNDRCCGWPGQTSVTSRADRFNAVPS